MMFCMVEWCLRMPLPLLMETSDSEKSCLHKVFRVRVVDVCGERERECVWSVRETGVGGGGWECVCERERMWTCVFVSVCMCLFLYVCMCLFLYVCMWAYVSLFMCVQMHVCPCVHLMHRAKSTLLLSPLLPCVKLLMAPLSTCAVYAHRHLQFTHAYLIVCSQCILNVRQCIF